MPLRTLLGYEPRQLSRHENYGGKFIAFASPARRPLSRSAPIGGGPSRSIMATRKPKFKTTAPMANVKRLPPIDEEGLGPRVTPRTTPRSRQEPMRRLPKNTFTHNSREPGFEPVETRPVVSVRPMPRDITPPDSPKYEYKKEKIRDYDRSVPALSPLDINHTVVDGLVADYLHYSRYGHVIPVYEGTSATSCPCCTDRNRQNVRTILGFPKDMREPPRKYDKQSHVKESFYTGDKNELNSDTYAFPNSMYAHHKRRREPEVSSEQKRLQQIAAQSKRQAWMNYQPLPYATTYLNPEFNRPAEVRNLYDTRPLEAQQHMSSRILEADSDYKHAMNRLESLTFGSGSYRNRP